MGEKTGERRGGDKGIETIKRRKGREGGYLTMLSVLDYTVW
jgi:hypothetical protein